MKRILLLLLLLFLPVIAHLNNSLQLVPEANNIQKAKDAADELIHLDESKDFWSTYNKKAKELDGDLGAQIRS